MDIFLVVDVLFSFHAELTLAVTTVVIFGHLHVMTDWHVNGIFIVVCVLLTVHTELTLAVTTVVIFRALARKSIIVPLMTSSGVLTRTVATRIIYYNSSTQTLYRKCRTRNAMVNRCTHTTADKRLLRIMQ